MGRVGMMQNGGMNAFNPKSARKRRARAPSITLSLALALALSACGSLPSVSLPFSRAKPTSDFLEIEQVRWAPVPAVGAPGAEAGWLRAAPGSTNTWMMRMGTRQYEEMVGTAKGPEVRSRLAGFAAREFLERRLCAGGKVSLRTPPMSSADGLETSVVVQCGE